MGFKERHKIGKKFENDFAMYLYNRNVRYERKGFEHLPVNEQVKENRYSPDFYLPDNNMYVECKVACGVEFGAWEYYNELNTEVPVYIISDATYQNNLKDDLKGIYFQQVDKIKLKSYGTKKWFNPNNGSGMKSATMDVKSMILHKGMNQLVYG